MKNLSVAVGAVAIAMFGSTAAWAGYKYSTPVSVNTSTREASGPIGYARNSSDFTQWIGCEIYGTLTGTTVKCYAATPNNVTGSCQTSNANLLAVAQGLNGDDFLTFRWDASGQCTEIRAYKMSYWEPKQP